MALNEIKFACPHCHQHIACDHGYCGYQIACPACQGGMIVPRLATFGFGAGTKLTLALPVATPVPWQVAAIEMSRESVFWSEREWGRHLAETERGTEKRVLVPLLLVVAPALLLAAINLVPHGKTEGVDWLWPAWLIFALLCSAFCGLTLLGTSSGNLVARVMAGLVLTLAIFAMNMLLAAFVGCTAGSAPSGYGY